ncbi:MAG TPA: hypothetical protein PLZ43_09230 [bacterium]|nr:hypothetical protein [bacterium]
MSELTPELTPEMIEFLAKQKKEADEKAENEKRLTELNNKRKAVLDSLETQGTLKELESEGIRDLLKDKPDLLDNVSALSMAIENARLKKQHKTATTPGASTGDTGKIGDPQRPSGANPDPTFVVPNFGTPEFFDAYGQGKITPEAIDAMELNSVQKLNLKMGLPRAATGRNPASVFM